VAADRPLPVQPFLRCAEDATARAGTPNLSAVQVLLPVSGSRPRVAPAVRPVPAMRTKEWLRRVRPGSRNSGRGQHQQWSGPIDPRCCTAAHRPPRSPGPGRVRLQVPRRRPARTPLSVLRSTTVRGTGPPLHGLVLRGELAEWPCDALGWPAEIVADSVAQLGVRSPLLLTVTRVLSTGWPGPPVRWTTR
jgi:hypothetical protein